MTRLEKNYKKLAILEVVKTKKDILFATNPDRGLTNNQKEEAWGEVLIKAKSLGIASAHRKWRFARDNLFGLWKSRMLAKISRKARSGGRSVLLDAVDEAILDIIGKDSPVIKALNLPEDRFDIPPSGPISPVTQIEVSSSSTKAPSRKRKSKAEDDEITTLKKKLLKVEIYKTSLETYKLERELGLPMSQLTNEIIKEFYV